MIEKERKRIEKIKSDFREKQKTLGTVEKIINRSGSSLIISMILMIIPSSFLMLWFETQEYLFMHIFLVSFIGWLSYTIMILVRYGTMTDEEWCETVFKDAGI